MSTLISVITPVLIITLLGLLILIEEGKMAAAPVPVRVKRRERQ